MIIVLHGKDDWRRREKAKAIINDFKGKHTALTFDTFDLEEDGDFARFREFMATPSLFKEKKFVFLKNIFVGADSEIKRILKTLTSSENETVLISESVIAKAWDFLLALKKPNLVQEFSVMSGERLGAFIKKEAEARGFRIQEGAVLALASFSGGDTWSVINELEKLRFLPKKNVDVTILRDLGLKKPAIFFDLIKRWSFGSSRERLFVLEEFFGQKEDLAKVFNILAYQDRAAIQKFADHDVAIKSGKLDYEEALLELALTPGL